MNYQFITEAKQAFPVSRLCHLLDVNPSGYHAWSVRLPSQRDKEDQALSVHVRACFSASHRTYGSPRITEELHHQGLSIGRRRVSRLMREAGLSARRRRRVPKTTDSNHDFPIADNLLDRDFTATRPNEKWCSDISYIHTEEGWLYLAVVIDLFARRVVGWAVSDSLHRDLVIDALNQAVTMRRPGKGLIHHSDRGSQYCSNDYRKILKANEMTVSMSRKGNCYDNAVPESFFKTLKTELAPKTAFQTRAEAKNAIALYINGFYNPVRLHSTIGFASPIQFESDTA